MHFVGAIEGKIAGEAGVSAGAVKGWRTFLFLTAALQLRAAQITLPIYIEDNHAGAFYWLAQHLDLEERCTLLHFDAHSDATAIFDSDQLRARLRRVDSLDQRTQLLEEWRRRGVVQCFNWIEPLMPAPIAQVIWISPNEQSNAEAIRQLDGHLEAAPRASGSFRSRFTNTSLENLEKNFAVNGPLIASVDLDYFAEFPPDEMPAAFERVWKFICERRDLRAIVIAISRPYLKDDAQANALVQLALRGAASLPTARLEFDPTRTVGNDQSLRARELRAEGREVPRFRLTSAATPPQFYLAIKNHAPSTDGVWRLNASEEAEVEVRAKPWTARFEKVQWFREEPIYPRCNLVGDGGLFGRGAPPRPRWREIETDEPLDKRLGVTRIKAHVDGTDTPIIEVRRSAGTGFRAALTEQFGLPYLFGSGSLRDGANTGPETGWGADCANFIVYALRRQGLRVPWSNPKQLRRYLEPVDGNSFSEADLERGLIVHLGAHVAALMEDRPPLGVLNAEDIVAHQLEGPPELLPLGELLKARGQSHFDFLRVPPPHETNDFVIGGDVMLGRSVGGKIETGLDPFAGIARRDGEKLIANLECVISELGVSQKKYALRAPLGAVALLQKAGFAALGCANNHSLDFGAEAQRDSVARLRAAGLSVVPFTCLTSSQKRVTFLALNDVLPQKQDAIFSEIDRARLEADLIIVLAHWGEENTPIITDRQRELARQLINRGADLIVGSHPHCVQPLDYYHGRPIAYSLGNFVFDGAPTVPGWNKGQLMRLGWDGRQAWPTFRSVAIELDRDGVPHPVTKR